MPSPPSSLSLPPPPSRVSSPASPFRVSAPDVPHILSLPGPPPGVPSVVHTACAGEAVISAIARPAATAAIVIVAWAWVELT